METAKSPEKLIASYREDNAYLKRAFDRQEEYIGVLQQQFVAAQTENASLHMQAELIQGQVKALRCENEALHDKSETTLSENEILRGEVNSLREQMLQLSSENEAIQTQLSAMTAQFQSIESSTIWRATKPLRTVLDLIKRPLKGSK